MNRFVFCRFSPFNFPQENMESRKNPIERKHSSFRPAVYSIYVMMQLPLSSFIYMFYSSSSFFIFLSLFVLLLTFYIYISINSIDFSCTDVENVDCNPDVYKILLMPPCLKFLIEGVDHLVLDAGKGWVGALAHMEETAHRIISYQELNGWSLTRR